MKKLTLVLDELEVESFEPEVATAQSGTVAGNEMTPNCQETLDPQLAWCVFSDANPYGNCTPICFTVVYECTDQPGIC